MTIATSRLARRASRVALLAGAALLVPGLRAGAQAVAARDLPRGHVLTAADIRQGGARPEPRDARNATLVGWTTRRVITAGQPLREPAVAPPAAASAITPGQRVAVLFREAGIELRLAGVAAGAAPLGARVKVRVDPTSRAGQPRRLEGTVVAPGVVQLP